MVSYRTSECSSECRRIATNPSNPNRQNISAPKTCILQVPKASVRRPFSVVSIERGILISESDIVGVMVLLHACMRDLHPWTVVVRTQPVSDGRSAALPRFAIMWLSLVLTTRSWEMESVGAVKGFLRYFFKVISFRATVYIVTASELQSRFFCARPGPCLTMSATPFLCHAHDSPQWFLGAYATHIHCFRASWMHGDRT